MTLRFLTAGESHGPGLVGILEGLPAGLPLGEDYINCQLKRRQQGFGSGERMKIESDTVRILSGVMGGLTTGAPLALLIENRDHEKWRGRKVKSFCAPRPGHADLSGAAKYGYRDMRLALERASARETAARLAVGTACRLLLDQFGVVIGGYVAMLGGVKTALDEMDFLERFRLAEESDVRCPDANAARLMRDRIEWAIQEKDTLGGIIEIVALNLPPGLGSHVHWDRRLDARLGSAMLGVQAIKGVEIGAAFDNAALAGTQAHDPILLDNERIVRPTNRSGGIEGGISNGQPIILRAAMKPIASTLTPQKTVDLSNGAVVETQYERSDTCPVPRAVPILEAVAAFVLAQALLEKLGGDSLAEIKPRFAALKQMKLADLLMDPQEKIFW